MINKYYFLSWLNWSFITCHLYSQSILPQASNTNLSASYEIILQLSASRCLCWTVVDFRLLVLNSGWRSLFLWVAFQYHASHGTWKFSGTGFIQLVKQEKNGPIEIITGYRAQQLEQRTPCKGGVPLKLTCRHIDIEEVEALAALMNFKCAVGIALSGGAKLVSKSSPAPHFRIWKKLCQSLWEKNRKKNNANGFID